MLKKHVKVGGQHFIIHYYCDNTITHNNIAFCPRIELKLKQQNAEEEQNLNENNMRKSIISLTKEKDNLLTLSMERGRAIQVTEMKTWIFIKGTNQLI